MLPDYPEFKNRLLRLLLRKLEERVRDEPLLQQVRHVRYFEGDSCILGGENADTGETGFTELATESTAEREAIIKRGPMAVVENLGEIAKDLQKKQVQMMFAHISQASEKAGTSVDAGGRPFDFDLFIEALERIQIDFDEDGRPRMPAFFVPPTIAQQIATKLPEWEKNPEYKQRVDNLIERKRMEWNDRESRRRLVD